MVDRGARRRERTRASLLEGARRVIAEKGFDAATITEITAAADVGFGSFYNHFESKDELLKVLVTGAVDAHGRAIDGLMAEESDPARLVAAGVIHTVAMAEHDPFWAWFMVRTGFGEHSELGCAAPDAAVARRRPRRGVRTFPDRRHPHLGRGGERRDLGGDPGAAAARPLPRRAACSRKARYVCSVSAPPTATSRGDGGRPARDRGSLMSRAAFHE